jgi:hypothetical protein
MPIWFELVAALLVVYAMALGIGWLIWGNNLPQDLHRSDDARKSDDASGSEDERESGNGQASSRQSKAGNVKTGTGT